MSFKTSVLIWFSRFRGTQPHPQPLSYREGAPNGVGLLCETEEHGLDGMTEEHIFNGISIEDIMPLSCWLRT